MTDYAKYQYTLLEKLKYMLLGTLFILVLGMLFYQSMIGVLFLSPLVYVYMKKKKVALARDRRWKLNMEFRDAIQAVSAALEAGYSAENSFEEACKDLNNIYKENSLILKEFSYIINQLRMNITVETALSEFSERTGVDDILSFAEVFTSAKRTGGDLIKVIRVTTNIINDKIEIKREIITMITAKRLEANIMKFVPVLILTYLLLSSPDFLEPLYHNMIGIAAMTAFLGTYLSAFLLIDKIVAIEL